MQQRWRSVPANTAKETHFKKQDIEREGLIQMIREDGKIGSNEPKSSLMDDGRF